MKQHTLRPMAMVLLSVMVTGLGLFVAHCADPNIGRAHAITIEWGDS